MKILTVCDQGNNRSVVLAHQLKYWGHDVIPVGLATNSQATLHMLYRWADRIIVTENGMKSKIPADFDPKIETWDVGPDTYPRPMNRELLDKVRKLMELHRPEYKATP